MIDKNYLLFHPESVLVFDDNLERKTESSISAEEDIRSLPNVYGFITKKLATNTTKAFYKAEEYEAIFYKELVKLIQWIESEPSKVFYIDKLGTKFSQPPEIWEIIVKPKLRRILGQLNNINFLWEPEEEFYIYVGYIDNRGKLMYFKEDETSNAELRIEALKNSGIATTIFPILKSPTNKQAFIEFSNLKTLGEELDDNTISNKTI